MPKQTIKIEPEDFEKEIFGDEEKKDEVIDLPKSSCSLSIVFVVLGVILISAILIIFHIKNNNINLQNKLKTAEVNNLKNESIDNNGIITLNFTESDLDKAISSVGDSFPLKNATSEITTSDIKIKGRSGSSAISLSIEVSLLAEAKDGKIVIKINSIKSMGVNAPKLVSDKINNSLDGLLAEKLKIADNVYVNQVNLHNGYFEIIGIKK